MHLDSQVIGRAFFSFCRLLDCDRFESGACVHRQIEIDSAIALDILHHHREEVTFLATEGVDIRLVNVIFYCLIRCR